jgi:multiple sugar transport system substrate-binding protein
MTLPGRQKASVLPQKEIKMKRSPVSWKALLAVGAAAAIGTAATSHAAKAEEATLKVAYSSDFVPLTPEGGKAWWADIVAQFEKAHPDVKVEQIPIPGSYADVENRLSLLFRSPSTAPDVAELSNQDIVQWVDSGYLAKITHLVADDSSWKGMPDAIKAETTYGGDVYGISHGENDLGLLYDKSILQKAGIALPWVPKNWADVLDAAQKIKASSPNVWPLWLPTGTAQGASAAAYGPNSFLYGSSDPTIYDTKTQKWVVDSKGIREVINLYKTAAAEGVLAPSSQLLNANAISTPPTVIPKHQLGITLAGNWFSIQWVKQVSAPYFPTAFQEVGLTAVPTVNGQGMDMASSLSGWDMAIYQKSHHKDLAWQFIQIMQMKKNLLEAALNNGWTPPVTEYAESKEWTSIDPFQAGWNKFYPAAVGIPLQSGYDAWALGFATGTEAVMLNPKLSVDDAVKQMSDYVVNQLGPDTTEVLK